MKTPSAKGAIYATQRVTSALMNPHFKLTTTTSYFCDALLVVEKYNSVHRQCVEICVISVLPSSRQANVVFINFVKKSLLKARHPILPNLIAKLLDVT